MQNKYNPNRKVEEKKQFILDFTEGIKKFRGGFSLATCKNQAEKRGWRHGKHLERVEKAKGKD